MDMYPISQREKSIIQSPRLSACACTHPLAPASICPQLPNQLARQPFHSNCLKRERLVADGTGVLTRQPFVHAPRMEFMTTLWVVGLIDWLSGLVLLLAEGTNRSIFAGMRSTTSWGGTGDIIILAAFQVFILVFTFGSSIRVGGAVGDPSSRSNTGCNRLGIIVGVGIR